MLPAQSASGPLSGLTRGGQPVARGTRTVKGVDYLVFKATAGDYVATYANDTAAPAVTNVNADRGREGHATVTWRRTSPRPRAWTTGAPRRSAARHPTARG